ncbi:hypothetical protein FEM48_Zijuj03G0174300 [Ziziphus jujuba var. spinosa]|uniref:RING-type E3 ubiquitin transferase n=1 Tax=Ziziphus jujuba var. spinosa TaxID=714518 RepID=A0A978VRN1_ZIZJJ|nr:hypothetical protein FEM48_Zijuj03G0174300 [Ziziphus jujuba var. spinosa]
MAKYCIGLLLLTIVVADIGLGAAQNECSESRYCRENGPPIRFPFRLKQRHPDYCGYPGFSVSCTSSNDTALELSIDSIPINFFVRNIDYKSQSIHIYDPNHCYEKLLLNIFYPSIPPFQLTNLYPYNCTLFNCSSLLELRYAFRISCLGDSKYQIYIIESADDIYDRSYVSCTKMYDLPGCPVKMYNQANDVQLKWSKPKCGACETKGDRCKFKNNNTRHETACLRKGVSIKAVVAGEFVDCN